MRYHASLLSPRTKQPRTQISSEYEVLSGHELMGALQAEKLCKDFSLSELWGKQTLLEDLLKTW